jgi:hypothetical protein
LNPDHRTNREVDGTYQQVARSSVEEAIEDAKTETERLSENELKQGVAAGPKKAYCNIATAVFLQKRYCLFVVLF